MLYILAGVVFRQFLCIVCLGLSRRRSVFLVLYGNENGINKKCFTLLPALLAHLGHMINLSAPTITVGRTIVCFTC